MNKQELSRRFAPLYVKKTEYQSSFALVNVLGKTIVYGLSEKIATAYARAINTFYAPDKHENSHILMILDIPQMMMPKSVSNTINITPDGKYIIEADRGYQAFLRDVKKNIDQYTTLSNYERKIRKQVWVEFVFHIKGSSKPTLSDLCNGGSDMLGYVGILTPTSIASLNNSRIVRDKTSRTEIIIREFKR